MPERLPSNFFRDDFEDRIMPQVVVVVTVFLVGENSEQSRSQHLGERVVVSRTSVFETLNRAISQPPPPGQTHESAANPNRSTFQSPDALQ